MMRNSPWTDIWIVRGYTLAIWLYPLGFREDQGDAMLQALQDALADPELPKTTLFSTLVSDLIQSLVKENLAMLRETLTRPVLLYNALILTALFTVLLLGFVIVEQQALRQTANDPQLGMAIDLASHLARGASPKAFVPDDQTDMDASLSPFVIAYDEQGHVLASSAQLNGAVPQLPLGVLEFVRRNRESRITWAPRRDVRIASVIRHVQGKQGGFVLAGRNLREIESRKDLLLKMASLVWLGLIGIIFAGAFSFGWLTRTPRAVAA